MSMWLLEEFGSSKLQILKGLRDRAMLLLATNVAFRGDSTRRVLWSDLFTQLVPMPSIGHDIQLPVRTKNLVAYNIFIHIVLLLF